MLDRLLRFVDESSPGPTMPAPAREQARARAQQLLEALDSTLVELGLAAEMFWSTAVDLAARPGDARWLIDRVLELTGVPRLALAREVLRAPQLPPLPAEVAIEAQLALVLAFGEFDGVSLSVPAQGGELQPIAYAGRDESDATVSVGIERLGLPPAMLAARGGGTHAQLLLELAAPAFAPLLEHEQEPEDDVMASLERRLARLRYDLHDGPQQDVHLLATDLELFRHQLRSVIAEHPHAGRLFGRLDDLAAQLVALDGDLRRLSSSMQSPFLQPGGLPDALREVTGAFAARTGVDPQTRLEGDFTRLTDSQQITLLALIREALSNIRQHSDARSVTIAIASHDGQVNAEVTDDGRGFDPETALVQAARDGHIGLVGMHERVRMLGGETRIESRPGGPTVISVRLPPWPPN